MKTWCEELLISNKIFQCSIKDGKMSTCSSYFNETVGIFGKCTYWRVNHLPCLSRTSKKKKKNGRVNHLPRLSRKSKKMKLSFRGTIVYRVINNIYIKCHTPFPNSIYLQTQLKPIHSINSSELFYNYNFKEISLALYVHI